MNITLHHFTLDCHGCDAAVLNDTNSMNDILTSAAKLAGLHVIGKLSHRFEPQGVTAVLLLSESHIAIHTWPEVGFAAIDVFSCKPIPIERMQQSVMLTLRTKRVCLRVMPDALPPPRPETSRPSTLSEMTARVNNNKRYTWRRITESETAAVVYHLRRRSNFKPSIAADLEVPLPAVKLIQDQRNGGLAPAHSDTRAAATSSFSRDHLRLLISKIAAERPTQQLALDQLLATPTTLWRRAAHLERNGDLDERRILFLGDDDHTSIAVAFAAHPHRVVVVDIDQRILEHIQELSAEYNLNITTVHHDLTKPLPQQLHKRFDCVFCDPSYTREGISTFLRRATEALAPGGGSCYLCCSAIDITPSEQLQIQRDLTNLGFVITEYKRSFNRYFSRCDMFDSDDANIMPRQELLRPWYTSSLVKLTLPPSSPNQ